MATVTGIAPGASGLADSAQSDYGNANNADDRTRHGKLRVAAVFSDHMVLQRETPIAVFGEAPAGEVVAAFVTDEDGQEIAQSEGM